jgi:rod shape determining protein RodA
MSEPLSGLVYSSPSRRGDSSFSRFSRHFDWILFLDVLFLSALGLVMVYSASLRFGHPGIYLGKQFMAMFFGMAALFLLATINYQVFSQYPLAIFGVSISLLVLVLLVGKSFHATRAWFVLGPFSFQPSELCKILSILILAGWCDKNAKELPRLRGLVVPFLIVLAHVGLILLQPDFGSTLVYFPILIAILYAAGANVFHLLAMMMYCFVLGTVVLLHTFLALTPEILEGHPVLTYFYRGMTIGREFFVLQASLGILLLGAWWFSKEMRFRIHGIFFAMVFLLISSGCLSSSIVTHSMKEYQRKRLIVFFNPAVDPSGSGYHVIQSVIALGSGKVFGKGLFGGTQSRLGFLPEQHTDFIFSVVGEELGFLMSGFILLLYLLLLWRSVAIAGDSRDRFGALVAVGIGAMFAFYSTLNLAMVMGMAPVAGLPLPFLSYGGSSMISSLAAIGLLLSVHARRYTY